MVIAVLLQWALGGVLFIVGWWGRGRASALVDPRLSAEARSQRIGVFRRGGLACQILAVVFVLVTIPAITAQGPLL